MLEAEVFCKLKMQMCSFRAMLHANSRLYITLYNNYQLDALTIIYS